MEKRHWPLATVNQLELTASVAGAVTTVLNIQRKFSILIKKRRSKFVIVAVLKV